MCLLEDANCKEPADCTYDNTFIHYPFGETHCPLERHCVVGRCQCQGGPATHAPPTTTKVPATETGTKRQFTNTKPQSKSTRQKSAPTTEFTMPRKTTTPIKNKSTLPIGFTRPHEFSEKSMCIFSVSMYHYYFCSKHRVFHIFVIFSVAYIVYKILNNNQSSFGKQSN